MKKILMAFCVALACSAALAQDAGTSTGNALAAKPSTTAAWPVWLAFNSTKDIDVIGLRLTLPYGACESVTGLDLGIYGRCRYFEGLQANILRNEAEDVMSGIQVGIYNTAGRGDLTGFQVGLFNEACTLRGFQVGLINLAERVEGFQVGLINRADSAYGFQVGGVNIIRDSELAFCPIVNIGFDIFPHY